MKAAALLLIVTLPTADRPGADDWVCVATADGKGWECGRGNAAPEPRALPPPAPREETVEISPLPIIPPSEPTPVAPGGQEPPEQQPTIFAPTDPARQPTAPQPKDLPDEGAESYTLQIASLAGPDEVEAFAENFEVDMTQAGRAIVMESGSRRHVLTYGWFDTPAAASAAADDLPPPIRALNPRVMSVENFLEPPAPLRPELARRAAAGTATEQARGDDRMAAAETGPEHETAAEPKPEPSLAPENEPAAAPASSPSAPIQSVIVDPVAEPIAADDPTLHGASVPQEAAEPLARDTAMVPTPATESSPRPAGRRPGDAAAFSRAGGRYTIQLANLPPGADLREFVREHDLNGDRVFALDGPDGRTLLVYGRFESLQAAETALAALPRSLVAPWIRRAAPLTEH